MLTFLVFRNPDFLINSSFYFELICFPLGPKSRIHAKSLLNELQSKEIATPEYIFLKMDKGFNDFEIF